MNFCAAILILKMEENMQHFGALSFIISRQVKTQLRHSKRFVQGMEKVLGAVTDWMCQKWFAKFLGSIDILGKEFFAEELSYALEDV